MSEIDAIYHMVEQALSLKDLAHLIVQYDTFQCPVCHFKTRQIWKKSKCRNENCSSKCQFPIPQEQLSREMAQLKTSQERKEIYWTCKNLTEVERGRYQEAARYLGMFSKSFQHKSEKWVCVQVNK